MVNFRHIYYKQVIRDTKAQKHKAGKWKAWKAGKWKAHKLRPYRHKKH